VKSLKRRILFPSLILKGVVNLIILWRLIETADNILEYNYTATVCSFVAAMELIMDCGVQGYLFISLRQKLSLLVDTDQSGRAISFSKRLRNSCIIIFAAATIIVSVISTSVHQLRKSDDFVPYFYVYYWLTLSVVSVSVFSAPMLVYTPTQRMPSIFQKIAPEQGLKNVITG